MSKFKLFYRCLLLSFTMALFAVCSWGINVQSAYAATGEVLILGPTVSGGAGSDEAAAVTTIGKTPVVVDAATWAAMTTEDFASYDAIVFGDPTCGTGVSYISAAEANKAVWSAAITGNVIIIGTDPVYHSKQIVLEEGIRFAADEAGKTGLYCCLSCYYYNAASGTPVPLLDNISGGGFTVVGQGGCPADSHIVAEHPALTGLTDAYLSNWGCSTHEGFVAWPSDFLVLVISEDVPSSYVAADGTTGAPYILARGEKLVVLSDIDLSPTTATNPIGTSHTVTATVTQDSTPVVGTTVTFTVLSGPHAGTTGTDTTDSNGVATFTYTGTTAGEDTIEASFVDSEGKTQKSNQVKKTWEEATAVELTYFKASARDDGSVVITWATATEVDNIGFNLYRSSNSGGLGAKSPNNAAFEGENYVKINSEVIPAKGFSVSGAKYKFIDSPGKGSHSYKLEDLDFNGKSTFHGPVSSNSKKAKRPNK